MPFGSKPIDASEQYEAILVTAVNCTKNMHSRASVKLFASLGQFLGLMTELLVPPAFETQAPWNEDVTPLLANKG
jgi:hypothetical protein